ncbi:MAG: L-serine ammonia-lyase [Candidatus Neomarinimicrobiota bacterium]
MDSIRQIYKIGHGPSSSHTMGPNRAAKIFGRRQPAAAGFRVTLYGSLAATGKGHLTDQALVWGFEPRPVEIIWQPETTLPFHPNGLYLEALDSDGSIIADWTVFSVGGGDLREAASTVTAPEIYNQSSLTAILEHCRRDGQSLWEYVAEREDNDLWDYLAEVWKVMKQAIREGLDTEGTLPGGLHLTRKAAAYYIKADSYRGALKRRCQVFAYALAVAEQNASSGIIVTAPTCGSSGVLPAVLRFLQLDKKFPDSKILRALATAGLIGNLVKNNASISGAAVGCQGEIGTACAMAAGATIQLMGGSPAQVEYAAEMGLEHHLGLTCDPVAGLVQVPCIERNAFAASRALDAHTFSMLSDGQHRVSFDKVVKTMAETGHDLPSLYRETSTGGLALNVKIDD